MALSKRGTAENFGKFLVENVGKVWYLIGTRGHKASPELIQSRWSTFISYRTAIETYADKALRNGPLPDGTWVVADCNGFLEMFFNGGWYDRPLTSFMFSDVSTYYMRDLVFRENLANGDMSTLPRDCPYPIAVGYNGHVVYFHKGMVYQAAGHSIGTILVSLEDRRYNYDWKFWYQIPWLDYGSYEFKEVKRMLRLTDPYMRGDDVKAFQEAANKIINAGLTVDGVFGQNSDSAARKLQAYFGLTADGIVGPATWAKIEEALLPDPPAPPPVNNTELAALRAKVTALTNEKADLEKKIAQLESSVTSFRNQLADAKNKLEDVKSDIQTLKAGFNILQNKY